jgi:hypothetical protein
MRVVTLGGIGQFHENQAQRDRLVFYVLLGTLGVGVGGALLWQWASR